MPRLGQLKEVHPEYADRVHVLAVDVDPSEKAEEILSYKESEGFPWPMTTADVQMLKEYYVTRQAAHMTPRRQRSCRIRRQLRRRNGGELAKAFRELGWLLIPA